MKSTTSLSAAILHSFQGVFSVVHVLLRIICHRQFMTKYEAEKLTAARKWFKQNGLIL